MTVGNAMPDAQQLDLFEPQQDSPPKDLIEYETRGGECIALWLSDLRKASRPGSSLKLVKVPRS